MHTFSLANMTQTRVDKGFQAAVINKTRGFINKYVACRH